MLTYTDVCADVLCSRFTGGSTLADLTAQTCKFHADAKLSAAAIAAKGEACFGTAGLQSQVCVISIVHDGIRRKICTTARAVAFVYCCNAAFVFFEIIRVPHVLLDQLWHGCSSLSSACFGCFVSRCIAEESSGVYPAVSVRKAGAGRQTERHILLERDCMVTDCVRVCASVCVRVMECMCFYQVIRAWLLEQPR
jgi:hypothetical protein